MTCQIACSTTTAVSEEFSYDPPGSTVTTDKPIEAPKRRSDWLDGASVHLDTDFPGARLNYAVLDGDSVLRLRVDPENDPINNSAWYAFRISSKERRDVKVELRYSGGVHRYIPKVSSDGAAWQPLRDGRYQSDTTNGIARFRLSVGPDTLWVAGQELLTSATIQAWADRLVRLPYVDRAEFGRSRQGRPLQRLLITEAPNPKRFVVLLGRQHPPEVTGSLALEAFVDAVVDSTETARAFRRAFATVVVPLLNPDGVDGGHWRHNAAGVDLNRDWAPFNQPETRQVRDLLLGLKRNPDHAVFFALDFHSTQEDVFYTLAKDLPTNPPNLTDHWLEGIARMLPDYRVNEESYGLGSPISKNWLYETFGCPSITYEAGDEVDRDMLRRVAGAGAMTMMTLLLNELPHGGEKR